MSAVVEYKPKYQNDGNSTHSSACSRLTHGGAQPQLHAVLIVSPFISADILLANESFMIEEKPYKTLRSCADVSLCHLLYSHFSHLIMSILSAVERRYSDLLGWMHEHLDPTDIQTIVWEDGPKGRVASWSVPGGIPEMAIFVATGRLKDGLLHNLDVDMGYSGTFDLPGHKGQAVLSRPYDIDRSTRFSPAETWPVVIDNINSILGTMPVKSDSTGRSSVLDDTGAAFTIKHRMWRPVSLLITRHWSPFMKLI